MEDHLMSSFVFVFCAGVLVGVGLSAIAWLWTSAYDSPPTRRLKLPPATARQLDRARRANRADLRPVLAAEHARRYVSPPAGDFDDGNTHP